MWKGSWFLAISLLVLLGTSCGLLENEPNVGVTAVASPTTISTVPSTTTSPAPTETPAVQPEPTSTPVPSPTPSDLAISRSAISLYPVPKIYAGDKVTFQMRPHVPSLVDPTEVKVSIFVDGALIGESILNEHNLAGEAYGLIKWAWDTTDQIGEHQLQVVLDIDDVIQVGDENLINNQIALPITVYDRQLLPEAEANATWVTADTACCYVHVVSGTAAYRDLPQLLVAVETAVDQAAAQLDEMPQQPIDIYFIDRVIGQGGYAGSELVVSYLDRDYAGISLHQVLVHEAVHVIDRQFAPQRIAFLAEGLAVWASGGHYKPEDIDQRAAALVELNLYVPLAELANSFYPVQHEIGYLEGASFVGYLVKMNGWSRFQDFYTDVTVGDAPTQSEALDRNLQLYYSKTLAEMEADWLAYLDELPWNETAVTDLQTTLLQYNIMRHYQRLYDPTAYFLAAWLPYPQEVQQSGNPADLTRHPASETNITLEVMLQAASIALHDGDYGRANVILDSVDRVLNSSGLFQDPLAQSYRNIIRLVSANGYEVQQVDLIGDNAIVWATEVNSNILNQLSLVLNQQEWILTN